MPLFNVWFPFAGKSAGAVETAHIISWGLAHLQKSWWDFYLPPQLQTTPATFAAVCRKRTGKDRHLLLTTNTGRGGETQSHACGGGFGVYCVHRGRMKKKEKPTGGALDNRADLDGGVVFPLSSVLESCDYGESEVKLLARTKPAKGPSHGIGFWCCRTSFSNGFEAFKCDNLKFHNVLLKDCRIENEQGIPAL